ncbi:hypothetical protein QF042_003839 [Pedobacter sp. W3I1]|nr:hypothetical protein [Pedobacter sp. W3I1]
MTLPEKHPAYKYQVNPDLAGIDWQLELFQEFCHRIL